MRQISFFPVLFTLSALALFPGCDSEGSAAQDGFSRVTVPVVRFGLDAEAALVEVSVLTDLAKRGAFQVALDFQGQEGLSPDLHKHQPAWQGVRIAVK